MGLSVKHLRNLFGGNIPTAQVLQSVASGMADCGVKVVIDPSTNFPYAVPAERRIVLPSRVKSSRALLIVSWYVDHEAGHIIHTPSLEPMLKKWINDSSMKELCVARGYKGVPDKLIDTAKFFHNCVEDVRIEKLMLRQFPGSKKHFIGGPIAAECDTLVEDTLEKSARIAEEQQLPELPLSPFWVAEMHASCFLGGTHGQRDRDEVRELLPDHVQWVCDIVDDVFGGIAADITQASCYDLADLVDQAMAKILDKVLPEAQSSDDASANCDGESNCQEGQGSESPAGNPFQSQMKSSGKAEKSKYNEFREEESGGSSEEEDGSGAEGSGDNSEPSGEGGESDDAEGGADSRSGDFGDGADQDSDSSGDSAESESGGSGIGDSTGGGKGDSSGAESSGGGSDSDDAGERQSGKGAGGDDSDSDSEDSEEGEGGAGESSGGDAEEEDSEDSDEGDGDLEGEDGDGDDSEGDSGDDGQPVTGDIDRQAQFDQVIKWAEDAQVDMARMMRESTAFGHAEDGEEDGPASGASPGSRTGATPGSPSMEHAQDIEGMPQEYLDKMIPGCAVHVIDGLNLERLFDTNNPLFSAYDNFIRSLMPHSLGPAARKLVGKFHGAPGKAWSGSRVNPRMLQPIVAGKAYGRKLYLKRIEPIQSKRGVCVALLIDCSGSMCSGISGLQFQANNYSYRSKFAVAHVAARSIARLLQTVNVPFAVAGFTTTEIMTYMPGNISRYEASRNQDIVNFMFKNFDDPWTASEAQMIAMNSDTNVIYQDSYISPQTNSDGESLLWLASQMITRDEDRKIIIVLSDGLPYAGKEILQSKFLKWAVRRVEIAGIHVGALGLGDEGVKHYYRLHELIKEFPPGYGTELTAPLYIQEKILRLIDKLSD
jgi:hypothetical protein